MQVDFRERYMWSFNLAPSGSGTVKAMDIKVAILSWR